MDNQQLNRLLCSIQQGDVGAYEKLYADTYALVCSVAYSVLHDRCAAEDVAQITFSTLWKNKEAYRYTRNPSAWLYTIAHNAALNYGKRESREIPAEDPALFSPSQHTQSPESTVIHSERIEQLFAVLTEPERKILVLHLVVGLKHREIAKMLNLPLGTVLSKYQNSLRKMRQHDEKDA